MWHQLLCLISPRSEALLQGIYAPSNQRRGQQRQTLRPMMRQSVVAWVALAAAAGFAVTGLLAWRSLERPESGPPTSSSVHVRPKLEREVQANRAAVRSFIGDPGRLEGHIRELSRTSSLAGSDASMRHVEYVETFWRDLGFKVVRRTYEVPMSYFNLTEDPQPSVSICRQGGGAAAEAAACLPLLMDKPLTQEDEEIGGIVRTFYVHSRALTGDFNLIRLSDIPDPEAEDLSAVLSGNLVLILSNETREMEGLMLKAGNLSTGFLLEHENPSASFQVEGNRTSAAPEPVYPNGTGLPDTAVTFHLGWDDLGGDPSTPGYPSKPYAVRRVPKGGWESALNATVVPISRADVERLTEAFSGAEEQQPFLRVNWPLRFGYRPVHDSCAEVPGWAEPDRVVLLGSHRDAWYGGAIDPHTGMATMLEVGRALAQLLRTGWRPRRTILMCAWDAEEIGLMGSVEWVEEEYQRAGARIVAYFNTDTDVMGNWKILVQASDQIVDVIRSVMSEVPNPTAALTGLPAASPHFFFYRLDDSSDYYAFTRALGVPACDLSYIRGPRESLVLYDLYHTRYETLRIYRMMDPGGLAHRGLTQAVAALVYTFADSGLLPLNMSALAVGLRNRFAKERFFGGSEESEVTADEAAEGSRNATTAGRARELQAALQAALDKATGALHQFESHLTGVRALGAAAQPLQQRMLNDKIMLVQKAFTHHCVFPCEGTSVNLLNDLPDKVTAPLPVEKLVQAVIFGLQSIPKILTDSFVED